VIQEGFHSLSSIISLAIQMIGNSNHGLTFDKSNINIPGLMQTLGVLISSVEVFVESATCFFYR
jgi:hypothetical protein